MYAPPPSMRALVRPLRHRGLALAIFASFGCQSAPRTTPAAESSAEPVPVPPAIRSAAPADAQKTSVTSAASVTSDAGLTVGPAFTYQVSVTDTAHALVPEHDALKACVEAGLDAWGKYLTGKGRISVEIIVTTTATAGRLTAASASAHYVGKCKSVTPCELAEDQSIHRLRTGDDNPLAVGLPDIRVYVTPSFWRTYLWMDPDPKARTAPVPNDRDDAISICTHELGHGFGMAGYRDVATYLPKPLKGVGTVLSPYDDLVRLTPTPTFVGPRTVAELGPVPLSHGHSTEDLYHYGNAATPTAYDGRLMNGVSFVMGRRYLISRVDVLMLQDLGVPIRALP
ncbi:hypothetical protein BH09MYX1_BH09MYX1_24710 [soil metagenome]